jgi:catechol 2,3-dioxygenase-like lactoylglutathione lyase family enzyme
MSRIFGDIRQNGYVVRDIEAAMKHWTETLGVGPFFYIPELRVDSFFYRGEPSSPPRISIALANSGDLQIELIQQHDDAPSMYRDFLRAGREGLQHVSSWVEDIDALIERAEAAGHRIAQSGAIATGVRFVYFDTELHPGTVFEVSNLAGRFAALPQMIADAARGWDGSDPIRVLEL